MTLAVNPNKALLENGDSPRKALHSKDDWCELLGHMRVVPPVRIHTPGGLHLLAADLQLLEAAEEHPPNLPILGRH